MPKKIRCPFHDDRTASLAVYEDTGKYYCFGCGAKGQSTVLGGEAFALKSTLPPVSLSEDFAKIRSLPSKDIRGLSLHADSEGYYILWPDGSYYKKRLFEGESKYVSPRGHRKPWLWLTEACSSQCVIVIEGELNALSVQAANTGNTFWKVVSPGSVGDFASRYAKEQGLTELCQYANILLIADNDPPGKKALVELSLLLAEKGKSNKTLLMDKDANEVLVQDGKEALRRIIEKALQ